MVMYMVVGHCAHATVQTPHGRVQQLHFKGAVLPSDVPEQEIRHLLSVGLIEPIDAPSDVAPAPAGTGDGTPAAEQPQPEVDPEVEAKRANARAKLPADGSPPDKRAAQAVWVEYLVTKGYDYDALAKEDKQTLISLAENGR